MANYEMKVQVGADERVTRAQLHDAVRASLGDLQDRGVLSVEVWDVDEHAHGDVRSAKGGGFTHLGRGIAWAGFWIGFGLALATGGVAFS